jgi:Transposase, Mutator family/PEP-CTERM motif
VSTRPVDELVRAMGGTGVSKSQVSRLCEEIDERVKAFLDRPLDGDGLDINDTLLSYIGFRDPWGGGVVPGIFSPAGLTVTIQIGVPEPSTWAMMLLGFAGFRARRTAASIA